MEFLTPDPTDFVHSRSLKKATEKSKIPHSWLWCCKSPFTKSSLCTVWHLWIHDDPSRWVQQDKQQALISAKCQKTKKKTAATRASDVTIDETSLRNMRTLLKLLYDRPCEPRVLDGLRTFCMACRGDIVGVGEFRMTSECIQNPLNHPSILWYWKTMTHTNVCELQPSY